jgi:hypothetical protein
MNIAEPVLQFAERWKPLAEWFTAIGTVGAVIVAVWLARRESALRLHLTTDLLLEFDENSQPKLSVACSVQNRGERLVTLIDYGFQLWPWRSSPLMIQDLPGSRGILAGCGLRHGDLARVVHTLDAVLRYLHDEGLTASRWKIWRIRMHVRTAFGDVVRRRIGKRLRNELLARAALADAVDQEGDSSTLP